MQAETLPRKTFVRCNHEMQTPFHALEKRLHQVSQTVNQNRLLFRFVFQFVFK